MACVPIVLPAFLCLERLGAMGYPSRAAAHNHLQHAASCPCFATSLPSQQCCAPAFKPIPHEVSPRSLAGACDSGHDRPGGSDSDAQARSGGLTLPDCVQVGWSRVAQWADEWPRGV
jgi:hypothetical protein